MTRYYRACDIIVGMRFHSLIMGLQLEKPTIALANHSQIGDFFEELGLEKYRVMLNRLSFSEQLIELIGKTLSDEKVLKEIHSVLSKLKIQNIEYQNKVISFVNN
jgi:polysaccharide pyruvyl transferase WcaK-like protein